MCFRDILRAKSICSAKYMSLTFYQRKTFPVYAIEALSSRLCFFFLFLGTFIAQNEIDIIPFDKYVML